MMFKPKFVYRKHLESHMWDRGNHMRPDVRVAIIGIVNQVLVELKKLRIPFDMSDIHDILVHGSMADYYYNKDSDVDVCIVCNFARVSKALPELDVNLLLKTIAVAAFANLLPLVCGRQLDITFTDVYSPKYGKNRYKVGGCYSVQSDKWVHKIVKLSKHEIYQKIQDAKPIYKSMRGQIIKLLVDNVGYGKIIEYTNALMYDRRISYDQNPEQPLTPYVIAYRMLKESGLLPKAYERTMKLRAAGKK